MLRKNLAPDEKRILDAVLSALASMIAGAEDDQAVEGIGATRCYFGCELDTENYVQFRGENVHPRRVTMCEKHFTSWHKNTRKWLKGVAAEMNPSI
jgi:hypothetical protein